MKARYLFTIEWDLGFIAKIPLYWPIYLKPIRAEAISGELHSLNDAFIDRGYRLRLGLTARPAELD
jgi:hypothetical protein